MARFPEFPEDAASKLVQCFTPLTAQHNIDGTYDRPLFLFLWGLFALWFERVRRPKQYFGDLQPAALWSKLAERVVNDAAKLKANDAKLDRLALAGVLSFLVPRLSESLQRLRGQLRGVSYFQKATDSMTFVPAFFVLEGLSLICPRQANFTQERCKTLLQRSRDYDFDGPALDLLREQLQPV